MIYSDYVTFDFFRFSISKSIFLRFFENRSDDFHDSNWLPGSHTLWSAYSTNKNHQKIVIFRWKIRKIECHVIRIYHTSTMPGGSLRSMNPSSRKKIDKKLVFNFSCETCFGPKSLITVQKTMVFHGFSRNDSSLRSCSSELRKPFRTSRHVFNTYIPRSQRWAGPYSMGIASRSSKFAKRSEFFQHFADPEDGPAYTWASFWISSQDYKFRG